MGSITVKSIWVKSGVPDIDVTAVLLVGISNYLHVYSFKLLFFLLLSYLKPIS